MPPLRLYLDTSVINFLFADDAPPLKTATEELFALLGDSSRCTAHASSFVRREIMRTRDATKRAKLLAVLKHYPIQMREIEDTDTEFFVLAGHYLDGGVLPSDSIDDAMHVAVATILGLDILVSWNYKHLANPNRRSRIATANAQLGYRHTPRLMTPLEVLDGPLPTA
jgi:predicted nucleic acid-binding protein